MNRAVLFLIMLLGHCFLPSCFPRFYILVKEDKTWDEAQSYCRSNYTDLATVQNEDEQSELSHIIDHELFVWLGLRPNNSWTWSLENQDYYGVGEDGFRKWASGKPSNALSFYQMCAEMLSSGDWADEPCSGSKPFFCYRETSQNQSSSFILVTQTMTWMEAQSYCRAHYIDLASVRNQEDNDQIMTLLQNQKAWMGLHRESWAWSDGSPYSFSYWDTSQTLSGTAADACLNVNYGQWRIRDCTAPNFFACYAIPVRQQLVRLVLKAMDSSLDMEQLKDDILQKFNQTLMDQSLHEEVQLSWARNPGGTVFCKRETGVKVP